MVRVGGCARNASTQLLHERPGRLDGEVRLEILAQHRARSSNGNCSASGSKKKSNGLRTAMSATRSTSTTNRAHLVGKDDARKEVAVRILLPVQEVAFGLDAQRIAEHRRAAVRRGPQTNDLRPHLHGAVVLVASPVIQGDVQGHELAAERRNPRRRRLALRLRLRLLGLRLRLRPRPAVAPERSSTVGTTSPRRARAARRA